MEAAGGRTEAGSGLVAVLGVGRFLLPIAALPDGAIPSVPSKWSCHPRHRPTAQVAHPGDGNY